MIDKSNYTSKNLINQSNLVHAFPSQSVFRHVQRTHEKYLANWAKGQRPRTRAVAKLGLLTHVGFIGGEAV